MTVIAWDGKTLAADRQTTIGDMIATRSKIHKLGDDLYFVGSGDTDRVLIMVEWVRNGCDPEKWPSFQRNQDTWVRFVVARDGKILEYNQEPMPIPCEDEKMAWGSGSSYAMGALMVGASAIEAVLATNKCCNTCGNGCDSVEVN